MLFAMSAGISLKPRCLKNTGKVTGYVRNTGSRDNRKTLCELSLIFKHPPGRNLQTLLLPVCAHRMGVVQLLSMQFAHAPQMARYHYEKFFGCEVSFGHTQYSFVISSDSLDLKSELADPSLMQLLLRQAEEAIASKPRYENLDQHIHMRVAEYLRVQKSVPKIEQIANELHVSARTLQRQLNDLSSSFKKIVEVERMKRCDQLLQQDM